MRPPLLLPTNLPSLLIFRAILLFTLLFLPAVLWRRRQVSQIRPYQTFFTLDHFRPFVQWIWVAPIHISVWKYQDIPTFWYDRSVLDQSFKVFRYWCQTSSRDFNTWIMLKKRSTPSFKRIVHIQQHGVGTKSSQRTISLGVWIFWFVGCKRFIVVRRGSVTGAIVVTA